MLAFFAALVLAADPLTCATDADCVLITDCGCDCCPPEVRAATLAEAQRFHRRCATQGDCANQHCELKKMDCGAREDPATVKAVCQASTCVKVKKPKPQCTADADCAMGHDCTCGCCSAPWEAMTKAKAQELRSKCAKLGPCGHAEGECDAVKCVEQRPASAVCRAERCVGVPTKR